MVRTGSTHARRGGAWTVAVAAGALAAAALPAAAQERVVLRGAEVSGPVVPYVFEGDLRDLPLAPDWRPGDPVKEIPRRHTHPAGPEPLGPDRPHLDPLLALQETAVPDRLSYGFNTPIINVAGQGYSGVNPPDTVGDAGQTYYIQAINHTSGTRVTLYNKADGSVVAGPVTLDRLGSGNCNNGLGDPIVLWDPLAQRWLLSEFSSFGSRLCVYISRTSNPLSGGWYAYNFQATNFPDYPKYAVWPDGYYVSTNENRPAVYALERDKMLLGQAATLQRSTATPLNGFGFQALTPGDLDGATAPPAGAPHYFIRHRDDEVHNSNPNPSQDFLEIWEYKVDWTNPANTTFTGPTNIPIAEIDSRICGLTSFSCFDQPGGANLDPLREVVMWRSQYRNFGTHQTLVGNLVTDVAVDRGGVRWYELRKVGAGGWALHQEGTYAPDTHNRWMGSAAMDGDGNLAVGYNVSSTSLFPNLRYAGRLATDPLGTLPQGENLLAAGAGSNASNRYGDYSAVNVDPEDDCTFWFTGEYNLTSNWSTRIGAFRFDTCTTAAPFVLASIAPGRAGQENRWTVVGAPAGAEVTVVCSRLGSSQPIRIGTAVADDAGRAIIARVVPPAGAGQTLDCRAIEAATGAETPAVATLLR